MKRVSERDAYDRVYRHVLASQRGHDARTLASLIRNALAVTKPVSPGAAAGRIDALTELAVQAGICGGVVPAWWTRYKKSKGFRA